MVIKPENSNRRRSNVRSQSRPRGSANPAPIRICRPLQMADQDWPQSRQVIIFSEICISLVSDDRSPDVRGRSHEPRPCAGVFRLALLVRPRRGFLTHLKSSLPRICGSGRLDPRARGRCHLDRARMKRAADVDQRLTWENVLAKSNVPQLRCFLSVAHLP